MSSPPKSVMTLPPTPNVGSSAESDAWVVTEKLIAATNAHVTVAVNLLVLIASSIGRFYEWMRLNWNSQAVKCLGVHAPEAVDERTRLHWPARCARCRLRGKRVSAS